MLEFGLGLMIATALAVMMWPLKALTGRGLNAWSTAETGQTKHALREEKARLLLALKELEFEFAAGKLNAQDYEYLRAQDQQRLSTVIQNQTELEAAWHDSERMIDQMVQQRLAKESSCSG